MTFTLWIVYALNLTKLQTDGEWRPWTRATKTRQRTNAKFYNKTRANNNVMNECVYAIYTCECARMWLWWVCIEYSRGALKYKNDFQLDFGLQKFVWFRADDWESEGTRECVCEREKKAEIFKYILHQVQDRECARDDQWSDGIKNNFNWKMLNNECV